MSQDKKKAKTTKAKAETEAKKADEKIAAAPEVAQAQPENIEISAETKTEASDEKTVAGLEEAREQVLAESEVQVDAQESQTPERETEVETVPEVKPEPEPENVPDQKTTGLKPVQAWMKALRLASWQSAALLRALGWTDDKQVTEAEFDQARKMVLSRTQGGNRRGGKQ